MVACINDASFVNIAAASQLELIKAGSEKDKDVQWWPENANLQYLYYKYFLS